jgi:ADP-dependent phosphofructokinase/glucokinase
LSVTRNDPENELKSLISGSLLAARRAERGQTCVPAQIPPLAEFLAPPWPAITQDGNISIVCCGTPYLKHPTATIGLGDTFLAGTLLILGNTITDHHRPAFARATAGKLATETTNYDQYTENH